MRNFPQIVDTGVLDGWGDTERKGLPYDREDMEERRRLARTFVKGDRVKIVGGEICTVLRSRGTEVFVEEYPRFGTNPHRLERVEDS
jgi:hypothetical protein